MCVDEIRICRLVSKKLHAEDRILEGSFGLGADRQNGVHESVLISSHSLEPIPVDIILAIGDEI